MTRVTRLCALGALGIALAVPQALAQPEGARGNRGNMQARMQMMKTLRAIDTWWTGVSFEVSGIDDAKLMELHKAFKEAWEARKKAFQDAQQNRDRAGLMSALKEINDKLEAKLKQSLTDAQQQELAAYAKKAMHMGRMGRMGRGRRGGGQHQQ